MDEEVTIKQLYCDERIAVLMVVRHYRMPDGFIETRVEAVRVEF